MSYSYNRVERRTRSTKSGGSGGGSYGYTGNRSTFGYWIPLALTVTAATVGIAAWIWSERKDDEDSSSEEHFPGGAPPPGYANMSGGLPPGPGPTGFQASQSGPAGPMLPQEGGFQGPPMHGGFQGPPPGEMPPGGFQRDIQGSTSQATGAEMVEEDTLVSRMTSGIVKRTPSPGQSYDWAAKKLSAGAAAAGAMVGGALSSIREGSPDYEDHERWTQEAEKRDSQAGDIQMGIKRQGTNQEFYSGEVQVPAEIARSTSLPTDRNRKSVAVVVSAVELEADGETDLDHHASILSHLPEVVDQNSTKIFVLIYAPDLKTHPLSPVATRRQSQSMTSSFSNISQGDIHTPAQTPGEFPTGSDAGILANIDPNPIDEASTLYKTLHNQASALVDRDTMIIPFTSRTGHKHILKSLTPEVVYIQELLCGRDGDIVSDLSGWVKQTVVVIGDEGGHGGLVDTDDEMGQAESKPELWWQKEERTGLGKRVAVVESLKVMDDWRRRVGEQD